MLILIISDIHANLTALDAVLSDAGEVDAVWCLGDLVGYGPDPNECVERIRQLPNLVCLIGNHDAAVIKRIDIASFNDEARQAVIWTQSVLFQTNLEYLQGLNAYTTLDSVTLAHGSPRQPIWEYLLDTRTATKNFEFFDTPFCFRAILNPGSVGQPRDRDPRAAYAIYNPDAQTWSYQRVPYDIPSVQVRMRANNLPQRHINRLSTGW
jgi:predicted phosphodiesterase